MQARTLLTVSKFFSALFLLLWVAFLLARDSWYAFLFGVGGSIWIINIIIWKAVAAQEEEDESQKY